MTTPNKAPKLFGVSDLRITKMLTDVAGSAPTYDSVSYDMPGVSAISISNDAKAVEGKGDERILEIEYDDESSKIDFEMLYTPMDAMQIINGGDIDTTSDADGAIYYGPGPSDTGDYFKIEALSKNRKEKLTIPKVKGRLYPSGMKGGQFSNPAFVGMAIHTTGDINGKPRRFFLGQTNYAQMLGGVAQVETATVTGNITTGGNATVTVTAAGLTGSPKAIPVAVAVSDSASVVAQKIREALAIDSAIAAMFAVGGSGVYVTLTRKVAAANDATLNIAIANGTCVGLTAAPTSTDTQPGIAP